MAARVVHREACLSSTLKKDSFKKGHMGKKMQAKIFISQRADTQKKKMVQNTQVNERITEKELRFE
jgi:hypothetical protein